MDLISPEYRQLNEALHAERADYGTGSFRWAQQVVDLKDDIGALSVLDYGCGKGLLRAALGDPPWLAEFDPAIPGKDAMPETADLVVCTDVLEHVEPERLDAVLTHLRGLSRKALFLVIATGPSTKTLADGRNAHLIQEGADWWKVKLQSMQFRTLSWMADASEIVAVVERTYKLGEIKVMSAVSETVRYEQAVANCAKVAKRLQIMPRHEWPATIVCYGPSLKDTWQQIPEEQKSGATVVSVSGAHDFLIERGIIPNVHIDVDPRQHKGVFTKTPHPAVKYWMASCVHPTVIDNLLPYNLTLWHVLNSENDRKLLEDIDPGGFLVAGGGSAGCRAVNVMYTQGFRTFSIYGMDCSFERETGEQHAGFHSGKRQTEMNARCGDRWFRTSGALIAIAKGFIENAKGLETASRRAGEPALPGGDCVDMLLHGDGLLAHMARLGQMPNWEAA